MVDLTKFWGGRGRGEEGSQQSPISDSQHRSFSIFLIFSYYIISGQFYNLSPTTIRDSEYYQNWPALEMIQCCARFCQQTDQANRSSFGNVAAKVAGAPLPKLQMLD